MDNSRSLLSYKGISWSSIKSSLHSQNGTITDFHYNKMVLKLMVKIYVFFSVILTSTVDF